MEKRQNRQNWGKMRTGKAKKRKRIQGAHDKFALEHVVFKVLV